MSKPDFYKDVLPKYIADPVLFTREVLTAEPDEWQIPVMLDLAQHPKVTVRSGQGVGKTALEAWMLLWFLTCFPFPRVVATAPRMDQLNDILWVEVSKWQNKSPMLRKILKWTKTKIYLEGEEQRWFAVARTASVPENMQGFHEVNMLFIVDEASGMADPIMETILGTLSGRNNKLLMCGNPTKTTGAFHDSHTADRALYKTHRVSSRDSTRTNKDSIAMLERKYGKDSNVVRVRVDGEFPTQEDDVFIPIALVENAIYKEPPVQREAQSIHIGCDVARFGDDKTVIGSKVDEVARLDRKLHGQDTQATTDNIILLGEQLIRRYNYKHRIPVKVDDTGVGGGVVDALRRRKKNNPDKLWWLEAVPVMFGKRISRHKYYNDSTSLMMGVVKELLSTVDAEGNEKPLELLLPDDPDLIAQLTCRKYRLAENSKIVVESKKEMKKRSLPSPDEADCLLLLCLPVKTNDKGRA